MAKIYGDSVVLVRRTQDGTITRTNAIVLASTARVPTTLDRKPIKDAKLVEHLDVAFPELSLAPNGQVLKTRSLEEIFRPAYGVAPWEEGAWIGFEEPGFAYTKSSGIDGVEAEDWTKAGQDKEGFPVPKGSAEDVTTNPPAPTSRVDGQVVSLEQLVDLENALAAYGKSDPTFERVPGWPVVSEATVALCHASLSVEQLVAIVNQKPEPAPYQPEEAQAQSAAGDAQSETANQQGGQDTANEG